MKTLYVVILIAFGHLSIVDAQTNIFKKGSISPKKHFEIIRPKINKNHLITEVFIGKKTYLFLIDSGAPTCIRPDFEGEYSILKEEITDGSQVSKEISFISIPTIKVGGLTYDNITAVRFDMPVIGDIRIDGILGANMMAKSIWDFDMINDRIFVSNKTNKSIQKVSNTFKIYPLNTGSPIFKITYFNTVEESIFFDTGYNGMFTLAQSVFNTLQDNQLIKKHVEGYGVLFQTALAAKDTTYYNVRLDIGLKNRVIRDVLANVDTDGQSSFGSELLLYNRVILDINSRRIYIAPYKNNPYCGQNDNLDTYGINITKKEDGQIYVSFLWNESEAEEKGIKIGDRILSINDVDFKNLEEITDTLIEQARSILTNATEPIKLEVNAEGNIITLQRKKLL